MSHSTRIGGFLLCSGGYVQSAAHQISDTPIVFPKGTVDVAGRWHSDAILLPVKYDVRRVKARNEADKCGSV